jgi:hypothetical protein
MQMNIAAVMGNSLARSSVRRRAVVMLAAAPVALAMAGSSLRAESRTVRSGEVTLRATQTAPLRLRLDVHAPPPAKIVSIAGAVGPASLAAPPLTAYPAAGQLAAIYILIDTSDPARRRVVARKLKHIRAMLKQAKPHHRFGLARFDQELRVLVPLGAGPKAVEAALAKVKAVGLRTYFFEAAIEASRQLGAFKADRRALFILSDGKIEDVKTAYDVRALVAAARRAGVRIYGVGYSSSAVEPPAFQNLRVPAKETGGRFVKTGRRFELPREFLAAPFAALRGGGRAVFDLTPTRAARLSGQATARITVALEGGRTMVLTVPILLPELPIGGRIGRLLDQAKERRNLPYTIGTGVVALALLALLFRWLVKLRQRLREARDYVAPAAIAVLEFFDEAGSKFDMVKKSVSIGRREDNDISLANGSVSGYHATIHRKSDGSFIITDQDSENGVSINDEEVKIAELKDGDDVELGEVRFRFSVPKEA